MMRIPFRLVRKVRKWNAGCAIFDVSCAQCITSEVFLLSFCWGSFLLGCLQIDGVPNG